MSDSLPQQLERQIDHLARQAVLLIATDYDGTLAPIVADPSKASPHRESMVALNALADLPQTHITVISGRSLRDLAALAQFDGRIDLVGSHGSEFDAGFIETLTNQQRQLLDRLERDLAKIAESGEGFSLERKPASIAFHYRNADEEAGERARKQVLEGPASDPAVYVKQGKKVVELGVVPTNKGTAFFAMRQRSAAVAAIFIGDDITDEDVFLRLTGPDVGVKVGSGESAAKYRVDGTEDVARLLARLCEKRRAWLQGADAPPIGRLIALSDRRTMALLDPRGSISWLCLPRLDSAGLFAELLGSAPDGRFVVRPVGESDSGCTQDYLNDSMVVQTRWNGVTVSDFLDCSSGRTSHRPGRAELIRLIEGHGEVEIEFAPRLDFGRTPTQINVREDGLEIEDTTDPIVLRSPGVDWEIVQEGVHQTARARVRTNGSPLALELRFGTSSLRESSRSPQERLRLTDRYWASWAERLTPPTLARELVIRSALVLKALSYGPSGAIAAAATTSLPECIGGVRNWDYRFCWVRDAAMSASSLVRVGSIDEAMEYLDWLFGVLDRTGSADRLKPLYALDGHDLSIEAEIRELSGYRGSRPVRVGNAASSQVQLDVFGPITELIALLAEQEAPLSTDHWRLAEAMVQAVRNRWREPDHGIWEIRKPRRHHVFSKVMCWYTVDRAIEAAQHIMDRVDPTWHALRDEISNDILENGFSKSRNAFPAAYDGDDLDAASLWVGLSGLIEPSDRRFISTIEAIESELRDGPTVYRYREDDGLPGEEGGFHICTSWLIRSYLLAGRIDDARSLFDDFLELAGSGGLYSEQYDPRTGEALGNHPQAYSHLALIDAAVAIEKATGSA